MCGILLLATGVAVQRDGRLLGWPDGETPSAQDFAEGLRRRGPDTQGVFQAGLRRAGGRAALALAPWHVGHAARR